MEVRPGYKQTEVGVIPEEWNVRPLGEVGEALIGLTYKPSDVREHGTLVLRSSNIQNDALAFDENVFVDTDIPERIMARPGVVLVCVRNGSRDLIGKAALLDERALGMTFGAFMAVYRSSIGKLASYLFQSQILKRQINEHLGATINQITNKSLNSFRIPVSPHDDERSAIAGALSDVDALLGGLERLIAKKRDLKQAAMQQLLTGRGRLPGVHGKWEMKALAAVCSMKSGEAITSANIDQHSQYPCYGGNGLRGCTSRFTHDGRYALIGRQGALCGNVFGVDGRFFASEHAVVVTACEKTDIRWLTYVLGTMNLNQYSESSAQPGLSVSKILNLTMSAPPTEDEQSAIAAVLSDMDAELAALEARRDKTRALKQAMMQELLTGRTRLLAHGAAANTEVTA
jgi:type I restriction enzyme S subunit